MTRNKFSFLSSDAKTSIHGELWLPEGPVRAVVQIAHGVSEYILRYEPLAAYLTERGIAVVGNDHLGHCSSVAPGAPRLYFGPKGSWMHVVEDLYTLRSQVGRQAPDVPWFLLGHSMGSFLARTYLIRYPGTVSGAVLVGTGQMSPALIAGGRAIAAREARRVGETHSSPLVGQLAFGAYNKRFAPNRTAFDWISLDPGNVDRYLADPMCGEDPSTGLFREMLWGISYITRPANLRRMNANTPVLFLSGAMDPVGDCGKGVRRAYRSFQKAGVRDVSIKLYPDLRHEIFNEACREDVYNDLYQWLSRYLAEKGEPCPT